MSRRTNYSSGSPWEPVVGYSRAVRAGNVVEVSGTTSVENGKVMYAGDAYLQTKHILSIIETALSALGAKMEDVVRTRMYVTDISKWQEYGKAHGEIFSSIRPASTMVEIKRLIEPGMLIEMEVQAVIEM
ncbi:MAG TPA: RidA family protein [Bacteroidia bacterium]|nr:RidA family protein [Bacteroidia bacterium]